MMIDGLTPAQYKKMLLKVLNRSLKEPYILYKKKFNPFTITTSGKWLFFKNVYYGVKFADKLDTESARIVALAEVHEILSEEEYLFKKLMGEIDRDGRSNT